MDNYEPFDEIDNEALKRCVELTRAEPDSVEQISDMLADRPFESVATFCAYHQQTNNLRLKPWEFPPCWIFDIDAALNIPEAMDTYRKRDAAKLLQRMLDLDISQFEPDPMSAIKRKRSEDTASQ